MREGMCVFYINHLPSPLIFYPLELPITKVSFRTCHHLQITALRNRKKAFLEEFLE